SVAISGKLTTRNTASTTADIPVTRIRLSIFQSIPDKRIIIPAININTIAVPKSVCTAINATGKAVNNNILAISHKSDFAVATLNFSLCFTTSIAKKTIIAILVNSDGWIVINGILLNQLFEPFTGSAIDAGLKCNRTTISTPNIYKYTLDLYKISVSTNCNSIKSKIPIPK